MTHFSSNTPCKTRGPYFTLHGLHSLPTSCRYFYGGQLSDGPQPRESPLQPYTVLSLQSREQQEGGGIANKDEVTHTALLAFSARRHSRFTCSIYVLQPFLSLHGVVTALVTLVQVRVVVTLVKALRSLLPPRENRTIGVITFYSKQKQQLSLALQGARLPEVTSSLSSHRLTESSNRCTLTPWTASREERGTSSSSPASGQVLHLVY